MMHRNIIHCQETHDDGIFLVGDAPSSSCLRLYYEVSCSDLIKQAAQRGLERQYREQKG